METVSFVKKTAVALILICTFALLGLRTGGGCEILAQACFSAADDFGEQVLCSGAYLQCCLLSVVG